MTFSRTRPVVFELCAETLQACLVAREGGADRIELCSALIDGGMTPSYGLIHQAVRHAGLPVHVLLRPRAGGFVYSDPDFQVMLDDLSHLKTMGVQGVVLGLLNPNGTVDTVRTRHLVDVAGDLEVTFHRAFDETPSLEQALEDVIATGCRRILTSGGAGDALTGSAMLKRLVLLAGTRITIAVGGNLRLANAAELSRATGATHFHGALRAQPYPDRGTGTLRWGQALPEIEAGDIAAVLDQLRRVENGEPQP